MTRGQLPRIVASVQGNYEVLQSIASYLQQWSLETKPNGYTQCSRNFNAGNVIESRGQSKLCEAGIYMNGVIMHQNDICGANAFSRQAIYSNVLLDDNAVKGSLSEQFLHSLALVCK